MTSAAAASAEINGVSILHDAQPQDRRTEGFYLVAKERRRRREHRKACKAFRQQLLLRRIRPEVVFWSRQRVLDAQSTC